MPEADAAAAPAPETGSVAQASSAVAPAAASSETAAPGSAAPADELIEFDWSDGKKYKAHSVFGETLKKAASLDGDYTKKMQKLADDRRTWDGEKSQLETAMRAEWDRVQMQQKFVKQLAKVETLQERLAQYENIDWLEWATKDPENARKHEVIRAQLERELKGIQGEIESQSKKEHDETTRKRNAAILEAQDKIKEFIPAWNKDIAAGITKFAREVVGVPVEMLNDFNQYPWAVRVLHMAMQQHQGLTQAQPGNEPAPEPTPVPKVGGTAPAAKSPDQMSTAEWMKWRTAKVNARAA